MTRLKLATSETFRSLGVRNFRVFFVGQAISQVGTWLQFIAQALLVLQLTDSGVALGLVTAFQFLPVLVFGAWAGVISDRVDKRKLMLVTQTAMMVFALVLGLFVLSGHITVIGVVRAGGAHRYRQCVRQSVAASDDHRARRRGATWRTP